ncbi:MAG: ribonuclease Z, partial [bacterium]|nr:ribonuclease Z [bacterium]
EGLLFDPGEGTQRQMIHAGVSSKEITKIFITHFHGDHCLGLPGVLQRLSLDRVPHPVTVFFPASGLDYFNRLKEASIFYNTATIEPYPIDKEGVVFSNSRLTISTRKLDHTVESWGYRISEPGGVTLLPEKLKALGIRGPLVGKLKKEGSLTVDGKRVGLEDVSMEKKGQKFAFVLDTRYCDNAVALAEDADMLVAESTFLNEHEEEALAHGHLTAAQAGTIARKAKVKQLVLTHFSQRYGDDGDFIGEAGAVFPEVVAANDGDGIEMQRKRGTAQGGDAVAVKESKK